IGGYMGAKLASVGVDVTLIARGPHLVAMQANGLKLIEGEGPEATETVVHPNLVADSRDAGPQDYVVLAVKAHSIPPALDAIAPLLGHETHVVPAQNGVPWWYFYGMEGPYKDRRLESVDPGGRIWDVIGPQRVIGCVVYPACEIEAPGVIRHTDDNRFSLREPVRSRLRGEIWVKVWGNVALNPLTTLTRSTLAGVCANPETRAFARAVMVEVESVTSALGEKLPVSVDQRLDGAAEVGEHKTSMLQDLELGRP